MPWVRVGDGAHSHPKRLRAGCEVWGFVLDCASWTAEHLDSVPDFAVPEYAMERFHPAWDILATRAVEVGLLTKRRKIKGHGFGYLIDQSDPELLHIRSSAEVHADRDKSRVTRQAGPVRDVRLRDGDQCRYCGKSVNWADRVSARGGTYDHPDPNDRETFVVACFGCNREKAQRTADQWVAAGGQRLLPVPDVPLIGPHTAQRFSVPQQGPERASTGAAPSESASAPGQHAAAAEGQPGASGPTCDPPTEVVQTYPRRDGPGRVGEPDQPVRAGPVRRTRRGTRGGTNPPPDQRNPKD